MISLRNGDALNNQKTLSKTANCYFAQSGYSLKIIQHQIYDLLISFCENEQIRAIGTGNIIPHLLHAETIKEFSISESEKLLTSIFEDAEHSLNYEVIYDVPRALYKELKKEEKTEWINESRIVALPNTIENACICSALKEKFTKEQILGCNGFIEVFCEDEEGIIHSEIRLDIDKKIIRNGFMIPIFSKDQNGLIKALKVFRYPNDKKPFILRSRKKQNGEINR